MRMKYPCALAGALVALTAVTLQAADFIPAEPLHAAGLVKYWQLQVPLTRDQQLQDVYLVDDALYLGTQDGYVYAVDAPTGAIRWLQPVTRSGYHLRRPCHAGDNVIFSTPTDVQVYERRSGDPVNRHDLDFPAGTAPVADGKHIFLGGLDRRLYALELKSQYLDWRVVTSDPISSNLVLYGPTVFCANDRGHVYACTAADKKFVWQTAAYGSVTAPLVADERGVFVASRDFSLYLLDLNFGNVRWRARFAGPLYDAPVLTPDLIFQYTPTDGVVAVEAEPVAVIDERIRWRVPNGRSALTVHEGTAYILLADGAIAAVDAKSGQTTTTVPAAGFTLAMPAPASSTVFVAAHDGRVFCARPQGVAPLKGEDLLNALRPPAPPVVATAASQPTTRPAAAADDPLNTRRSGTPVGGKSKVSREYK
jgi:eukaryotic-like serine/threonine-protein kinase